MPHLVLGNSRQLRNEPQVNSLETHTVNVKSGSHILFRNGSCNVLPALRIVL